MTETYGDWETPGDGPTRQRDDLARRDTLRRDLSRLYEEMARLEDEIELGSRLGVPERLVFLYNLLAGLAAGFAGATGSLLFNILGSLLVGRHPLEIIRILLTFPLGTRALQLETGPGLAAGLCLYLLAGSLIGVAFHAVLSGVFAQAPGVWRLLAVTSMGLALWVVDFYVILGWLQPLFTGDPHITDLWPAWLAALSHLVYAWMVLLFERRVRHGQPDGPASGPQASP
jgi:hypothetical protein